MLQILAAIGGLTSPFVILWLLISVLRSPRSETDEYIRKSEKELIDYLEGMVKTPPE